MTKSPFLDEEETMHLLLRTIFTSNLLSPQLLHEATGVSLATCINFIAEAFAAVVVAFEGLDE